MSCFSFSLFLVLKPSEKKRKEKKKEKKKLQVLAGAAFKTQGSHSEQGDRQLNGRGS